MNPQSRVRDYKRVTLKPLICVEMSPTASILKLASVCTSPVVTPKSSKTLRFRCSAATSDFVRQYAFRKGLRASIYEADLP